MFSLFPRADSCAYHPVPKKKKTKTLFVRLFRCEGYTQGDKRRTVGGRKRACARLESPRRTNQTSMDCRPEKKNARTNRREMVGGRGNNKNTKYKTLVRNSGGWGTDVRYAGNSVEKRRRPFWGGKRCLKNVLKIPFEKSKVPSSDSVVTHTRKNINCETLVAATGHFTHRFGKSFHWWNMYDITVRSELSIDNEINRSDLI